MTLRDIKAYLSTHQRVTLLDLAHHFDSEPHIVQPMLEHWQRKGKVRYTLLEPCTKGCCNMAKGIAFYEWVE